MIQSIQGVYASYMVSLLGTPKTSPLRHLWKSIDNHTSEGTCKQPNWIWRGNVFSFLIWKVDVLFNIYQYIAFGQFLMNCHELYLTSASNTSSQSSSSTSTVSCSLPTKITESSNRPIDSLQPRYGRSWIPPYQTPCATRWMVGFTTLFLWSTTHVHVARWDASKVKKAITGLSDIYIALPKDASRSKPSCNDL